MNNRLKCGRCGDVFHTKPLYTSEPDEGEDDIYSPIKDENAGKGGGVREGDGKVREGYGEVREGDGRR